MDFLLLLLVILAGVLWAVGGRRNHPGMDDLRGWAYAHRGLHRKGVPENSMAAFRAALDGGYGIELDLHLTKDGHLAVIHDSSLSRTAGIDQKITDLTFSELSQYPLEGTEETIPEFSQVLSLFAGKAPMIVELKPDDGNYQALTDAAVKALEGYEGPWCMESFDPRCVYYLKKAYPQIIRGQLAENFMSTGKHLPFFIRFYLTHNLFNLFTRPDFVAYRFDHRKVTPTNSLWQKLWKLQGVTWTLRSQADFDQAVQEGWLPIFENFIPEER